MAETVVCPRFSGFRALPIAGLNTQVSRPAAARAAGPHQDAAAIRSEPDFDAGAGRNAEMTAQVGRQYDLTLAGYDDGAHGMPTG